MGKQLRKIRRRAIREGRAKALERKGIVVGWKWLIERKGITTFARIAEDKRLAVVRDLLTLPGARDLLERG